jgi:hypothetical protein
LRQSIENVLVRRNKVYHGQGAQDMPRHTESAATLTRPSSAIRASSSLLPLPLFSELVFVPSRSSALSLSGTGNPVETLLLKMYLRRCHVSIFPMLKVPR